MRTIKQRHRGIKAHKSCNFEHSAIILIALVMASAALSASVAQDIEPDAGKKPLDSSAFQAVTSLFRYDRSIPLDARVLDRSETDLYVREKIVFSGVRGTRVPGYLAYPKSLKGRAPVILLIHAGASSKEAWWEAESFERGRILSEKLLQLGFAVLALDGQFHGERSAMSDYLPVSSMVFDKKWFFRIREGVIETVGDYFRAVDYLRSRAEIDTDRIGVVGHSMGGMIALIFAALVPSVKAVVGCVAACTDSWMYPATPVNLARGIRAPTLLLAARSDEFFSVDSTKRLYAALKVKDKKLEFYDGGHRLPENNIARTVEWLCRYVAR